MPHWTDLDEARTASDTVQNHVDDHNQMHERANRMSAQWLDRLTVRHDQAAHAEDDEFDDAAISGSWTRVVQGSPVGTWSEADGVLSWIQTGTSTTATLDVYMRSYTPTVGDVLECAFRYKQRAKHVGPWLGFSDGTTYGTSNAVGCAVHTEDTNLGFYRFLLNEWGGFNTRTNDGTLIDFGATGQLSYMRVDYEAANTWGLLISTDGVSWYTVETGYSATLSPTHVGVGVGSITGHAAPEIVTIEYFRVIDA